MEAADIMDMPSSFYRWAYGKRADMVRRLAAGEKVDPTKMFLSFTTHCPTFISSGPAGLNGSVKGIGWLPKEEYRKETLDAYLKHIATGWRDGYSEDGLRLLVDLLYGEGCEERIDFTVMSSMELAKKHSWENFNANDDVTLSFFEPPVIHYEVRGKIEIVHDGLLHQLVNAQHDVYHKPGPERWPNRPVYIVHIEEIFDNSATKTGFGTKMEAFRK